ncbi:MAG: hypothetical protein KF696_10760 [Planctomycetes bacterium]|nr:hypothetical protein [Planctomycetota bacterium]MCW8135090.1 hypothetical protein [Planctomycetota bacterium]
MRYAAHILVFAALLLAGCKGQFWVWQQSPELIFAEEEAEHEQPKPEPEPDQPPQAPKEIIFVLGIDGMD